MSDDKPMTDLGTMKADMAVLADEVAVWDLNIARAMTSEAKAWAAERRDTFKRAHDYLSARLADAEQPAVAGDGGLRDIDGGRFEEWSLSDFAGQCRMQARDMLDPAYSLFMAELAKRLAALSTSVPAGVVGVKPLEIPKLTDEIILAAAEAHYGKRRVAANGGPGGISMTVCGQDYTFSAMMRRMWPAIRRTCLTQDPTR